MNNSMIRFVKSSGIFFIGNVLSKVVVFFLLPVYTAYIPTADYGYYDLSIIYLTVVMTILFLEIWSGLLRFIKEQANDHSREKVLLSGTLIFEGSALVYTAIAVIGFFFFDIPYLGYIYILGLTMALVNYFSAAARGLGKNMDFVLSGIFSTLVMVAINLLLLVGLKWDYSSLYIAAIGGNIFQIIFIGLRCGLFVYMRPRCTNHKLVKEMFLFSLPLCLNVVSSWLITSYNRTVISQEMTLSDNGIYAIGNKFSSLITLVTTCFLYAWQEISFSRNKDSKSNGRFYSTACKYYLIFLGCGTALLIPAVSIFFPFIVNESYWEAKSTLSLFLVMTMMGAYSTFVGNIFYALKDTKVVFISLLVSGVFNVLICGPLIRVFGLNGANMATCASYLLNILIRNIFLKHRIGFNANLPSTLAVCGVVAASMLFAAMFGWLVNLLWMFLLAVALLLVFRKPIVGLWQQLRGGYHKGDGV